MDNAIEIENLQCGYNHKFTIRDISFTVERGKLTSIIGPNGAGKTTLYRAITGMLPVQQGSIRINGTDAFRMTHKARAKQLAIVNQTVEADFISIEDYVLMGRLPYHAPLQLFESKEDYAIAEKNMRLTGIWEKRAKLMNQLSGGEQQLAAIARALTQQTEILLLDEPTSHLDISHQMRILNLVQRLNREQNLTVLLIIHDLNLASEFSDRLIMLKEGSIHSSGTPEEVLTYDNIESVYDTLVITQSNPLSGKPCVFPVSDKHHFINTK